MAGPDDKIPFGEGADEITDPHINIEAIMRQAESKKARKDLDEATFATGDEANVALRIEDPEGVLQMREEFLTLESPHDPRMGGCTFLIVDLESLRDQLLDTNSLKILLSETRLVLNAKGYHVKTDQSGHKLTILGTAERSENSILATAESLRKQLPMAKIFIGSGGIDHPSQQKEGDPSFIVHETPMDEIFDEWRTLEPGVYLTKILDHDIKNPETRKGSHCHIETRQAKKDGRDFQGLVKLDKYEPKPTLLSGGPDKLIGYERELETLDSYMRDDETRLISLEGKAGMGKSRILATALQNIPSAIVCSLDGADRTLQGSNLVTIADQLAHILGDSPLETPVQQFSKKARSEKIELAQNDPKKVFDMCLTALIHLNLERGEKTLFVLEDIHFADRHSEPWITSLVSEYLNACKEGKALFTMRPEEMYKSEAQKKIAERVEGMHGKGSAKTLTLKGLDFTDPTISEKFAFHSIPKAERQTASGTAKTLGEWHKTLGKKAGRSPFRMKTFMDTLNEWKALITTGEVIEVNRDAIAKIEEIGEEDGDLATHYRERIERLEGKSKLALQYIGLLGGKITFQQLLTLLSRQFLSTKDEDLVTIAMDLEKGGYICLVPGQPKDQETYTLQHESISQAAVDSIPQGEKRSRAILLYGILRRNDLLFNADMRFSLLHQVATDAGTTASEARIWNSLENTVYILINDAKNRNSSSKAYAVAEAILDPEKGVKVVRDCIADLKEGRQVPEKIRLIISQVLQAKASSAVYLGKATEALAAIADLKAINGKFPGFVDIGRVHLMEFEVAYIADAPSAENKRKIQAFFDTNISPDKVDLPEAEKLIARIKLLVKLGKDREAIAVFNETKTLLETLNAGNTAVIRSTSPITGKEVPVTYHVPSPSYMEARRLAEVRCPFEITKNAIIHFDEDDRTRALDEDVIFHRGALTDQQAEALTTIQQRIAELLKIKEKHPLIFDRYAEMGLLGMQGQIKAFLGNPEAAKKDLSEAWRQADQAEVHRQGVRYAKMEGDITVIQALSSQDKQERIKLLKEAHQIYSSKCMLSLAQMDQGDSYQTAIRIQRIRAAGRLLLEYDIPSMQKPVPITTQRELRPYIEQAINDFIQINRLNRENLEYLRDNPEEAKSPDERKRRKYQFIKGQITEIHYYMMGYMGHVVKAIKDLGFAVPSSLLDATKNPFANHALDGDTLAYTAQKSDKEFGNEVTTKYNGLGYLITGR